jgi:hypothetical protein
MYNETNPYLVSVEEHQAIKSQAKKNVINALAHMVLSAAGIAAGLIMACTLANLLHNPEPSSVNQVAVSHQRGI